MAARSVRELIYREQSIQRRDCQPEEPNGDSEEKVGCIPLHSIGSTTVSIWLVSGLILRTLGVIWLYLGKVLEQVMGRPLYHIAEVNRGGVVEASPPG